MYSIIIPCADLKAKPDMASGTQTQILYGETVNIIDDTDKNADFYHVANIQKNDSYIGYIQKSAITATAQMATHRVINRTTLLFEQPNIKCPLPLIISLGACVKVATDVDDRFYQTDTGHYVLKNHVMPIDSFLDFCVPSWIKFLHDNFYHTPYLWGGRSSAGIDCSGLVQLSLQAFGIFLPRDSSPQQNFCATDGNLEMPQAGDLIFWAGHVGIMASETDLIHANAFHMKTITEKLSDVIKRNPNPVTAVKKIIYS